MWDGEQMPTPTSDLGPTHCTLSLHYLNRDCQLTADTSIADPFTWQYTGACRRALEDIAYVAHRCLTKAPSFETLTAMCVRPDLGDALDCAAPEPSSCIEECTGCLPCVFGQDDCNETNTPRGQCSECVHPFMRCHLGWQKTRAGLYAILHIIYFDTLNKT